MTHSKRNGNMVSQDPEVVRTRNELYRKLALVPNKRYVDCSDVERRLFDAVHKAGEQHKQAVRLARQR